MGVASQNGGQCQDSESSSYVCVCPAGFTGSRCEHSQALHCHPGGYPPPRPWLPPQPLSSLCPSLHPHTRPQPPPPQQLSTHHARESSPKYLAPSWLLTSVTAYPNLPSASHLCHPRPHPDHCTQAWSPLPGTYYLSPEHSPHPRLPGTPHPHTSAGGCSLPGTTPGVTGSLPTLLSPGPKSLPPPPSPHAAPPGWPGPNQPRGCSR